MYIYVYLFENVTAKNKRSFYFALFENQWPENQGARYCIIYKNIALYSHIITLVCTLSADIICKDTHKHVRGRLGVKPLMTFILSDQYIYIFFFNRSFCI